VRAMMAASAAEPGVLVRSTGFSVPRGTQPYQLATGVPGVGRRGAGVRRPRVLADTWSALDRRRNPALRPRAPWQRKGGRASTTRATRGASTSGARWLELALGPHAGASTTLDKALQRMIEPSRLDLEALLCGTPAPGAERRCVRCCSRASLPMHRLMLRRAGSISHWLRSCVRRHGPLFSNAVLFSGPGRRHPGFASTFFAFRHDLCARSNRDPVPYWGSFTPAPT
jgi:hypothetical protein